jgi:23S rRNA pseudouridine1911/1915/1917 synthase
MIPVHPTARYFRSTVVKLLAAVRPDERFYLAHRLDRETSGVLLLTKTKEADRHVKKQFAGLDPATGRPTGVRYVEKRYVAISRGEPRHDTFTIDEPLAPDDSSGLRVKMRTTRDGGQEAITICTVLERRRAAATGEPFAVVACDLLTGRQHQIRVHLASVGLPLVGDKLYGADDDVFRRGADGTLTDEDRARLGLERHALHAQRLSLLHPATGERTVFESPLPPDLARFLATLDP